MRTRREYETLETIVYPYNNSYNVRVSMIDQEPWFAVTDVLKILDASYLPLYVKDVKVAKSKAGDRNVRLKFISLNTLLEFINRIQVNEEIKIAFRSWLDEKFRDNDTIETVDSDCTSDNSNQEKNRTSVMSTFVSEEFGNVRVVMIDNEPWFVGKDIAENLGYTNASKALSDHVDQEDKLNNEMLSSLGQRGGWLINESGMYSLILSSKLPSAKKFKRWVAEEIQNIRRSQEIMESGNKAYNSLEVFNNPEFGNIRTIVIDGDPYFCGIDIAKALGYKDPNDALDRHCRYPVKRPVPHPQSKSKTINVIFIPEADVYKLIFSSKLPSAERFTDWVTSEVLPALRKTGHYETPEFVNRVDQMFSITAESIKALAENMTVLTNTMVQLKEIQDSHSAKIINLEEAVRKLKSSAADSSSDYDQEERQAETDCKYDDIDPRKYGIDPDSENWRMQANLLVRKIAIKRGVRVADIWRSVYTILAKDYQVNLEDELQKRRTEMHKKHISESKIEALNKLMIADENPDLKLWIAWIICGIYRGILVA